MTDLEDRTALVRGRLARHILVDLRCAVATPSREKWIGRGLARYGWAPPAASCGSERPYVVSFCPELIVAITAWLDDEELDIYLTATEAFIDAMATFPTGKPDEVYHAVHALLRSESPDVVDLLSEVELRALDGGLVATGCT